jgi:hypothetical protein
MESLVTRDRLRSKYKSQTAISAVSSGALQRECASERPDPFVVTVIDDFLANGASRSDAELESCISSLTGLVQGSAFFPASADLFDLIVAIMLNTRSESLFRHCAGFLFYACDFYTVDFLTAHVTEEFLDSLRHFTLHSKFGIIWHVSKLIGYLAILASEMRDAILLIMPFQELLAQVHCATEGADRWNSAFLGIACRCCVFPLSPEISLEAAEQLIALLPLPLGDQVLSLIVHTLYLLCAEPGTLAWLSCTPTFAHLADRLSRLLHSNPDRPKVRTFQFRTIEDILVLSRQFLVRYAHLPIPSADLAALIQSPSPQVCLRALELATEAIMSQPEEHVGPFLRASILDSLYKNLSEQTAPVKVRSAEFLFLISHWMGPHDLEEILGRGVVRALVDLFELADARLTIKVLDFFKDVMAKAVEHGQRDLALAQFEDAELLARLEQLEDTEDPDIAAFVSAFLMDVDGEEEGG